MLTPCSSSVKQWPLAGGLEMSLLCPLQISSPCVLQDGKRPDGEASGLAEKFGM